MGLPVCGLQVTFFRCLCDFRIAHICHHVDALADMGLLLIR